MKSGSEQNFQLTSSAPLWIASRSLIAQHGADFFSRWSEVAQAYQEDEVHDLRVASRRLREGLFLFSPCFPEKERKRLAKKVKKVTRMLGELRNTDEAVRFFSRFTTKESSHCRQQVQELLAGLRLEREQVHEKLEQEFAQFDPEPLKADFYTIREDGNLFFSAGSDPFVDVLSFAGEAISERAATVGKLLPAALQEADGAAQHRLRIAVKKLRYRLELLAPFLGESYPYLHKTLKEYQDALGKLHDVDVFGDLVRMGVPEGEGREALLQVMAERRVKLFRTLLALLEKTPLDSIGDRAREALISPNKL
ncbi:CHAD domain-containing protein [Geomonas sp.]|uniref:CHAD domain-containing protein n=1 Tax=Geomonas sp. TaxID=2651584 RepID=UPI002B48E231|nr:CHAD domain-containing protein [Geomonas sp.]HJV35207.1 CHAD domain-containing protein [Geomonas sp.]